VLVDLFTDCPDLVLFELADADAASAFGGADQRRIYQLQDGALAESMRDDLGAPAFLAKQWLQQIGGADRPAMAEWEAQIRNAGLKIVLEAGHGAWQIVTVGDSDVVAQQLRQSWRGRLVADKGAGLEGPEVF